MKTTTSPGKMHNDSREFRTGNTKTIIWIYLQRTWSKITLKLGCHLNKRFKQ